MNTIAPKFPTWKEVALIDGMSIDSILSDLQNNNIKIGDWPKEAFKNIDFESDSTLMTISLALVSVSDLGLANGAKTDQIYQCAADRGLGLCDPRIVSSLRIQYKEQCRLESVYVAMEAILGDENFYSRFRLIHAADDKLWVTGDHHHMDDVWNATDLLVFTKISDIKPNVMPNQKYTLKDYLEVESSLQPSWNYDGTMISYLNNASGTNQLYVVASSGGESRQLTHFPDSISFALFSPTKNEILFGKDEGGDEKTQLYMYVLDTGEIKNLTNRPEIKYNSAEFSNDGMYIVYSDNSRNGKDFDTYIMNLETESTECLYADGGNCDVLGFSPRGTYLAMRKNYSNVDCDLFLISIKDKSNKLLTNHSGTAIFGIPAWLLDESAFFCVSNQDTEYTNLRRYDFSTDSFSSIFSPIWDVQGVQISHNGEVLSVTVNEDGYHRAYFFEPQSMSPIGVDNIPENRVVYGVRFSPDSKRMTLTLGGSRYSTDVWMYSFRDQEITQLTHSMQQVRSDALVEPTLFHYQSFDGLTIPAFLYLPKNSIDGEKIPVIIHIHGGPESQYLPSLTLLTQYFVSCGYAVIAPNVRGSSGYGKKYLALDDVEKRLDSVHDIAMLHEYIQTRPELDAGRVALIGGSYGGFMVLAGLAFYPDLWVGGVDIVGIANFITFLENTASYRRAIREAEYGSLENDRELLFSISPINHIEKIKAPLFIIHGANDPRVPLNEAQQVVEKMTARGMNAELLVYQDEGHGLSKLTNKLDAYPQVVAFLEKVFR